MGTRYAHGWYAQFGFEPVRAPQRADDPVAVNTEDD